MEVRLIQSTNIKYTCTYIVDKADKSVKHSVYKCTAYQSIHTPHMTMHNQRLELLTTNNINCYTVLSFYFNP